MSGKVSQRESAFYDALWAEEWHRLPSRGPLADSRERLVLRALGADLRPQVRLLDVGCGDGTFLLHVLARHPRVDCAGIDFSATAIATSPPQLRSRLRVGNVERLQDSFAAASFDLAVSIEVLEHVADPAAVLSGIADALRPGGALVLTVPHAMAHWSDLDDAGGHLRRFEVEGMRALLLAAGLAPERLLVWGGPIALPYYALTKRLGSRRVTAAASRGASQLASRALQLALRIDDLFPNRRGFQLVARARRA